jgi:hypothetical protein
MIREPAGLATTSSATVTAIASASNRINHMTRVPLRVVVWLSLFPAAAIFGGLVGSVLPIILPP